ncbi:hypothetical protein PAMP_005547 [Pampus punctatissimus]
MNTYRTRRCSPEERHCNVHTRAAGADRPFPNKPVHHRRLFNPKMHHSPELHDFEKITISAQPRGPLSSQEYYPRKDRLPNREVQMARAIHAKELILQEKLWRAEDKIRQKIQKDATEEEEEKHDRGQVKSGKALKKTRLREPARSRDMLKHERRPEDVKQLRNTQNQTNKDMIRNTHEEQEARWGGRETEAVQLKRKGNKDPHESTAHVHKVSRDRRKGEAEKAEQSKTSRNYDIWTRETTYKVRKKVYSSHDDDDDDDDMTHKSQQKAVHRLKATENHGGSMSKISEESSLPPVSSPSRSSAAQQGELRLTGGTHAGLLLLPCRICNRKFSHERIEKHVRVCQKVQQSQRQVFNSYANRTKGSAIEEFWRNHSRSKTPEVLKKKKQTQNHKMNTRTLHQGRLPAGTSQSKRSK